MKSSLEMPALKAAPQPDDKSGTDTKGRIRLRAYQLYEQRGRKDGHDVDDWLQAESELTAKSMAA